MAQSNSVTRSNKLGPEERAAATDLLDTFLRYSQGTRG